jgi:type 1 fimbriae regulatory protein FimB
MSALLRTISEKKNSRRDWCMVYMAFIHGLRVSELTGLKLADYDRLSQRLHIRRLKGGFSTTHPVLPEEQRELESWLIERARSSGQHLPWLFLSSKGGRLSRQRIYALIKEYGMAAALPVETHPHMLRHACGYGLAELGNDTRLIQDSSSTSILLELREKIFSIKASLMKVRLFTHNRAMSLIVIS